MAPWAGRRSAVLAVCAAAVLGTGTAPVRATGDVGLHVEAPERYVMYAADEGARASNRGFTVPVGVRGGTAENLTLIVDASELAGVARLTDTHCTDRDMIYTCDYGSPNDGESMAPFGIHGVAGVRPGEGGTIRYTVTADNAPTVTGSTRMVVGGPALTPHGHRAVTGAEPGRPLRFTPAFTNRTGLTGTEGVGLKITVSDGLALDRRYGNCHYQGSRSAWCEFPTRVAPRTAYRTGVPLALTVGPEVINGSLWYETVAWRKKPAGHTKRGRGAPLTLVRTAEGEAAGTPGLIDVRTGRQADYRPVTGTVEGRVGETVEVGIGVRNAGPGDPGLPEDLDRPGRLEVIPPEGTTVTSIPRTYDDFEGGGGKWACDRPKKSGGPYVCDLGAPPFGMLPPGRSSEVTFHFRIDRKVPGARGSVRVFGPFDRTPANDTAPIPVRAHPPAPRAGRSPVVSAGAVLTTAAAGALGAVLLLRRRALRRRPADT
ncbi:hypothetical protein [Streptomyces carminius]|nr:hypothetical protein [Streptomyces carminius]